MNQNQFLCNMGSDMINNPANTQMWNEEIDYNFTYIMAKMLKKHNLSVSLHSSELQKAVCLQNLGNFLGQIGSTKPGFNFPNPNTTKSTFRPNKLFLNSFFEIPSHVNYVTETFFVPSYLEKDQSHLRVLCSYLSLGPLHKLIREKGGAYGAGARLNQYAGALTFATYRDPNTVKSLENFDLALQQIAEGSIT